jgi:hypothetical protein
MNTRRSALETQSSRFRDRFLAVVDEWDAGCLFCGADTDVRPLPGSAGAVVLPLCHKHVRWAMACRREQHGKQARHLRGLVLAWARLHGGDRDAATVWLNGHDLHRREST